MAVRDLGADDTRPASYPWSGDHWNTLLDFTIAWRSRNRGGVVLVVDEVGLPGWVPPYAQEVRYDPYSIDDQAAFLATLRELTMTVKSGLLGAAVVASVGVPADEEERLARDSVRRLGWVRPERSLGALTQWVRVADLVVYVTSGTTAVVRKNRGGEVGVEITFGPEPRLTCTPPQP